MNIVIDAVNILTPRHRQIVYGIANEMTIKEIAVWMGTSNKNVEYHMAVFKWWTGIYSYAGITRLAIRLGLCDATTLHHPDCLAKIGWRLKEGSGPPEPLAWPKDRPYQIGSGGFLGSRSPRKLPTRVCGLRRLYRSQ